MPETLSELIRDTLLFLKDPLQPKQTIFATREDCAYVQTSVPPCKKGVDRVGKPVLIRSEKWEEVRPAEPKKNILPTALPPKAEWLKPQITTAPQEGFAKIKKTLQQIAPSFQLIDEIPTDHEAKRISSAWKEKIPDIDVILLACQTDPDTLDLLKSLAIAIEKNLGKVKILPVDRLEREKRWDLFLQKNQFRLIIASDGLLDLPGLMQFYKATPARVEYYLDKTPLLPLLPSPVYKAIEQKAHLWKMLCQILKK